MADRPSTDPIQALAERIARMEERLNGEATRPLIVPQVSADPSTAYQTNIWVLGDGSLRIRLADGTVKAYAPIAPPAPPAPPAAPPPQPVTRQAVWEATWGQAYRASGGFTGGTASMLYWGSSGDSYNGRQRSLVGFDYASIQSALSGSWISGVEFWVDVRHTYWNNGGKLWLGLHSNTSKPGTWGGLSGRDFVTQLSVPKTGSGWYSISTEFGATLRDGSSRGVTFMAPNDDRTYYGYASGGPGTSQAWMPKLRITYVK